ncbi:MAG: hypothetical protein QXS41_01365 [Candidatus Woesearchaeota archaeon]
MNNIEELIKKEFGFVEDVIKNQKYNLLPSAYDTLLHLNSISLAEDQKKRVKEFELEIYKISYPLNYKLAKEYYETGKYFYADRALTKVKIISQITGWKLPDDYNYLREKISKALVDQTLTYFDKAMERKNYVVAENLLEFIKYVVNHEIPKNSDFFNKYRDRIVNIENDLYNKRMDEFIGYKQSTASSKKELSLKKEEKSEKVKAVNEKSEELRKRLEKLVEKTNNQKTSQPTIDKKNIPNKEQKQEGRIADKIKKVKEELNKISKQYEEKKKDKVK